MFMKLMGSIRLLPLLAIIAAISFGMRFGDFIEQVTRMSPAQAEETAHDNSHNDNKNTDNASLSHETGEKNNATSTGNKLDSKSNGDAEDTSKWRDSLDTDFEYSDVQIELFEDLAQRRKDLDKREKELAVKDALLKAAQQEMEQKFKELTSLRSEIEELLVEQTDEEKLRISSLVKIYEGMKAKDAARIFNTLDLDVLMQVVTQMSERKSAPIIAAMDVDRARTVTIMLAERKQLPKTTQEFF